MSDRVFRLSFMVGPVQGFVAQARRTKDFWSGSWLLSYLCETALVAAEKRGGEVIIPFRDEADTSCLTSLRSVVGGIPNRFELRFANEELAVDAAREASNQFRAEWRAIAAEVWTRYVASVAGSGNETSEIWKRQIDGFWEVSWVVTSEEDPNQLVGDAIAARKQYRNVPALDEPGTKCSLMSDFQEISGHFGPAEKDGMQSGWSKQKSFWSEFRSNLKAKKQSLDLGKNEQLCAIALIKRFLPHILGVLPQDSKLYDAKPDDVCPEFSKQANWPSLGFFAALPWLKTISDGPSGQPSERVLQFIDDAMVHDPDSDPGALGRFWDSEIAPAKRFGVGWATVDASAWFEDGIQSKEVGLSKQTQAKLREQLQEIYKDMEGKKPLPYYALLFMDGDSMGELLDKLGSSTQLSEKLLTFSKQVEMIVDRHQGRAVYAGGDDVLAFLPAAYALDAATELADWYQECFSGIPEATLSGAIIYSHWHFPLSKVIRLSHYLLDDIAKEATGRNSMALAVVQGSGLNAFWSAPWPVIRGKVDSSGTAAATDKALPELTRLIDRFTAIESGKAESEDPSQWNASYLYGLRQQFSKLFPCGPEAPGSYQQWDSIVDVATNENLLVALSQSEQRRRMSARNREQCSREQSLRDAKQLIAMSQQWTRDKTSRESKPDPTKFTFDGWQVARFLKQVREGVLPDHV